MGKFLYSVDGEHFEELGHMTDIELSAEEEEIAERLYMSEPVEITAQVEALDMDGLVRSMLGQSAYNSMKLRQDGYLSPENGWFTPVESPAIELDKKIDKERRRHDKERERSTKSGIEE